jgi:hypothetical protein
MQSEKQKMSVREKGFSAEQSVPCASKVAVAR